MSVNSRRSSDGGVLEFCRFRSGAGGRFGWREGSCAEGGWVVAMALGWVWADDIGYSHQ